MIYTLCGSSRFPQAFHMANMHLTLRGHVVLSLGIFGHADEPTGALHLTADGDEGEEIKQRLDRIHFDKIRLCDRVMVINVGGYIGSSTRREIDFALASGKEVVYLFPETLDV